MQPRTLHVPVGLQQRHVALARHDPHVEVGILFQKDSGQLHELFNGPAQADLLDVAYEYAHAAKARDFGISGLNVSFHGFGHGKAYAYVGVLVMGKVEFRLQLPQHDA